MSAHMGTDFTHDLQEFLAARRLDTNLSEMVSGLALGLSLALAAYQGDDEAFDEMLYGLLDLVHRMAHKHRLDFAQFQARVHLEDGGKLN